jgi:phosphoribosylformylglycinamidine (FGAM) synthase-like enzyme
LAVSLAKACFAKEIGAVLRLSYTPPYLDDPELLFEEGPTQVLISCDANSIPQIEELAKKFGLSALRLGTTTPEMLTISIADAGVISAPIAKLKSIWSNALQSTLSVDTVTA